MPCVWPEATAAYEEALALTDNDVERAFLTERRDEVHGIAVAAGWTATTRGSRRR